MAKLAGEPKAPRPQGNWHADAGEMNLTYKWHIRCQIDAMMHAAATALLKGMS